MSTITNTKAPFTEVQSLMERIALELEGEPSHVVNMACIGMCIIMQSQDISGEALATGIKGASEWIAAYCLSLSTPKERMH